MDPVTQEELDAGLIDDKICAPDEAIRRAAVHRNRDASIVLTNGYFDLLHKGHMHLLREASRDCDPAYFVVALNTDASAKRGKGDDRPFQPLELRAKTVAQIPFVDVVTWFDEDTPESLIREIQPDVLVKGSDWADRAVPGAEFVRQSGGQLRIVDLIEDYSTTSALSHLS